MSEDYEKMMRLDVTFDVEIDNETGQKRLVAAFNPARYSPAEVNGEEYLYDELDKFFIPISEVKRLVEQALSTEKVFNRQPQIHSTKLYVEGRKPEIQSLLQHDNTDSYVFADASEEYLASIHDGPAGYAVISLDIVGSTLLANDTDSETYAKIIGVVLAEIARVFPLFHGHILKYTGDGVLGYIPPPGFNTANDLAIDCALTLRSVVRDAIVPILVQMGLPQINVRIGLESGEALSMTIGHDSSKQHKDLIGATLNLACKIQSIAGSGQIYLGEIAYRNLHTMWKLGCERAETPESWSYRLKNKSLYPVHHFKSDGAEVDGLQ